MWTSVLLLIVGLALITLASDWLVDGASALARRVGVTEFVIGMTVVGFGTSMPELVSSLFSALEGHGDMAVGNVTGSNVCNALLILGLTALIFPLSYSRNNVRRDIPICIASTALLSLMVLGWNPSGELSSVTRWDGLLLLACFTAFMIYSFKTGKTDCDSTDKGNEAQASPSKIMPLWKSILLSVLGIAGLIVGGRIFVSNTVNVAHALHVSDAFIAVTVMAFGTSAPELATCIVAAVKKRNDLALGNIIGSNIFNILLIIGICATVTPLNVVSLTRVDLGLFVLSSILLLTAAFCFKRNKLDRGDAVIYLLLYMAYAGWLVYIQ